jgi:hypothetical protein
VPAKLLGLSCRKQTKTAAVFGLLDHTYIRIAIAIRHWKPTIIKLHCEGKAPANTCAQNGPPPPDPTQNIRDLSHMRILSLIGLKPKASVIDSLMRGATRRLVQRLEQGAYWNAEQILSGTSDENRDRLIYGAASDSNAVALATQWTAACPASSLAHTVLGASLISAGWKIRGERDAKHVDPAAWAPFQQHLEDAMAPLSKAAQLDINSAEPYAWLILSELGRQGPRDGLASLFEEAIARDPLHWPSHYKYFLTTTAKWGGSHREMFRFATQTAKKAPVGSMLHSLVASAYNEFALAAGDSALRHLRTKEHAETVASALYAWLDATPSTLSAKLERGGGIRGGGYGLNHFAVACYLCGATREAQAVMAAMNKEIEPTPWAWIARNTRERRNPGFIYDRAQREVTSSLSRAHG